jgi:EXLDI family protein
VPNKTIYVSEGDLPLFERAQQLAGGNLSQAISKALHRWVETAEGLDEGYKDVVVRVGVDKGRKVRFVGMLVGDYMDPKAPRGERIRVYRGRSGKYVVHVERQPEFWTVDAEGKPATGWRGWMGVGGVKYGESPKESSLEVVATLDELFLMLPDPLFEMVARAAQLPTTEELDI